MNPIIKDVKCGGYFKLTSHVEGTKTCYTGGNTADKSINKDQFIKDIVAAQLRDLLENNPNFYELKSALETYIDNLLKIDNIGE